MKQIILLVGIFLWTLPLAFSQGNHWGRIQEAVEELDLSASQEAELKLLAEELSARRAELRSMPRSAKKRQLMRELGNDFKEGLAEILNEDQIAQLRAMRRENREDRQRLRSWMAEHKEELKQMKSEIKAYSKENILPEILDLRAELDKEIAAADQEIIEELRGEAKMLKEAYKAKRKELKNELKDTKKSEKKAKKRELKQKYKRHKKDRDARWKEENPESWAKAERLVESYQSDMDRLFERIEAERKTWRSDIASIAERYTSSMPSDDKSKLKRKIDKYVNKFGENHHRKYLGFLLMNPKGNGEELSSSFDDQSEAGVRDLQLYPNPAISEQTLQFDLETSGRVKIEIVDKTGLVLSTVHDGDLNAGTHTFQTDISNLKGYVFYYRIQTVEGTVSREFVKK